MRIFVAVGRCVGSRVHIFSWVSCHRRIAVVAVAAFAAAGAAWISIATVEAGRLASGPAPTELSQRAGLKLAVRSLFEAGDFAALDRMAEDFRSTGARTSSGVWKLTVFYGAFHELAGELERANGARWQQLFAHVDRWRERFSGQPTAYVVEGEALKTYAFSLRPRFYVHEASTGGDAAYSAAMRNARDFLDRNKAVAAADPHFYVVRADIAAVLGEEPDRFMDLVNEGLVKSPGYYQLYFSGLDYFATSLTGDDEARAARIEAFANSAVARTQAQEGKGLYARLYWHAYSGFYGNQLFQKSRADWPKMRAGLEDVIGKYPDAWNVNHFAYLSCLAGDRDTTRRVIGGLGDHPALQVWQARAIYEGCRSWAASEPATARH